VRAAADEFKRPKALTVMNRVTRILLIEDNAGDADLVRIAMKKVGDAFALHHEATLADGLERLAHEGADLALVALTLPDAQGLTAVTRVRSQCPDLPLVVLTSLANDRIAIQALDRGAQDYLVKGEVTPEVLQRTIRYAIQRQRDYAEIHRLLRKVQASRELLKKKNRRLGRLCKTAHRFVDNVSHEFRTPLTVIKEYVSLLGEGLLGEISEEQRRFLDTISDRADDLNNMVDDMLDVSRLEPGVSPTLRDAAQDRTNPIAANQRG
jgi:hypothetical protein